MSKLDAGMSHIEADKLARSVDCEVQMNRDALKAQWGGIV
ncbi:hypothetical protein K231HA_01862 [Lactococcus lactis]|nr:hypothetical protein [Lactococcus lactis]